MKKILALLLAVLVFSCTLSAYAAETSVDRESGIITVSGAAEPFARVMLIVLKEGKTAGDLTDLVPELMMEAVEHMDQTRAGADGSFEFTYASSAGANYARFAAMVNTTNEPYVVENLEIKYYTSNTSAALTNQLVAMTEAEQVSSKIDSDTIVILGLNTTFYDLLDNEGKLKVYQAVADMTQGGQEQLQETFYYAGAVEFINSRSDFSSIYDMLEKEKLIDEALGFDKSLKLYKGLDSTEGLEERIMSLLPAKNMESLRSGAREAFALEAIENYKYTFTEEILTAYNDVLDLDLDLLDSSNETEVYKALAGNRYENAFELSEAFEEAVEDAEDSSGGSSSGGGSSGGGASTGGSFKGAGRGSAAVAVPVPEVTAPAEDNTAKSFTDLPGEHYAKAAVDALSAKGIISGYPDGSFAPDRAVNRMEFVKMLVAAFGIEKTDAVIGSYTDLKESDWYYDYCAAAISNDILKGVSDTEIGAALPVTRQDVCVLLDRMLKKKGYELEAEGTALFADEGDISDYAKESVRLFAQAGIVSGSDGSFLPKDAASRAECAKIIYNVMMEVMG